MKTCKTCLKENKSNYTDICQICYNNRWFASNPLRECATCHKEYKGFGVNCAICARKLRESIQPITPCSSCGRVDVKIKNKTLVLCSTCYRNKNDQEIPGFKENRILKNRIFHRKYRGTDPNLPYKKNDGNGYIDKQGYRVLCKRDHPNAEKTNGHLKEHTFVMSKHIGRPLRKGETVHHKNGIRHDNRIENLELWHVGQPAGQRVEDKISWCKEFLKEYGYKFD